MRVRALYAERLRAFSGPILGALSDLGIEVVSDDVGEEADVNFLQVHASPFSFVQDCRFIDLCLSSPCPTLALIHRPDELMLSEGLLRKCLSLKLKALILMGDHIPEVLRRSVTSPVEIIPHPYTDLGRPSATEPVVVGTFTSFGEVRRLQDVLRLFEAIQSSADPCVDKIRFALGGILDEKPLTRELLMKEGSAEFSRSLLESIVVQSESFIPHFHVQLYHLHQKKRYCESSGSLHRGITIPVIFEANGIERVEGIRVVKVSADDDLREVDFSSAADEILNLVRNEKYPQWLNHNHEKALKNQPADFARRLGSLLADG